MTRPAAAISLVLLFVAAIVLALATMLLRPLPVIDGDVRLIGLRERGEIVRDAYGIPHVYARNAYDLFFLQGYATAQDRLFQMDLYRRAGNGRLAEVLGEGALEADRTTRTLGLARGAALDLEAMSAEARLALEAYAAGVNKLLEQRGPDMPIEFVILGYRPEPWRVMDSLVIGRVQALDLAVNYQTELLRAGIALRLGEDALATLVPDAAAAVALDASWHDVAPLLSGGIASPGLDELREIVGSPAREGLGSNCWALAGTRTRSGRPLLAGDVHLGVRNPSIWHEVALEGAGYKVVGATIPGIAGVIIGHNEHIAWSFTVAYVDVQDLYVERSDPADPRRFRFGDVYETARTYREQINVRGRPEPVPLDVVVTRHGPIITPILRGQQAQIALRWTANDAGRGPDAILALDRARDWDAFRAALRAFPGPPLAACYADVSGHIGYQMAGEVPLRARGDGRMPVPGWTGEHEWAGVAPFASLASVLDPPGGLVIAANDRPPVTSATIGHDGEWDAGFRARRLAALLANTRDADVASLAALQSDVTSLAAPLFRQTLLDLRARSPRAATAQRLVREWDGVIAADSAAAAVYEAWLLRMVERTFHDKLGQTLYREYLMHGRYVLPALHRLQAVPASPWFTEIADPAVRGRDEIAARALDDAVADLRRALGADPERWRWGDLHTVTFEHVLSAVRPLGLLFDVGPLRRPGDSHTVNTGAYQLHRPFAVRTHASFRMVADLADLEASMSVIATGVSGMPFSPHRADQTPLWASGQLHPMRSSRDRLGPGTRTLTTRPR